MRSVILSSWVLAAALAVATPGAASAETPVWAADLATRLPLMATVAGDVGRQSVDDLRRHREALLTRLYLRDGRASVGAADDLYDAVVLVAVGARLAGTDDSDPIAAVRSAYVAHLAGHTWARAGALRAEVDALITRAPDPAARVTLEQLRDSAQALREVGRAWLSDAVKQGRAAAEPDAEVEHLAGLALDREDRHDVAVKALSAAAKARTSVPRSVDLARALARAGKLKEARELATQIKAMAPGTRGRLDAIFTRLDDERTTRSFEARSEGPLDVSTRATQAWRYARLGRPDDASRLLEQLLAEAPERPEVRHLAAELWLRWRRFDRLNALFEAAAPLDARMSQARLVAGLEARLAARSGGERPALADVDLGADLDRLVEMGERHLSFRLRLIAAAARQPTDQAGLERLLELGSPLAPSEVMLGAALWITIGDTEAAVRLLARAPGAAASVTWAGLQLALGAGRGDDQLVAEALDRLDRVEPGRDAEIAALAAYHRAIGGRLQAWLRDRREQSGVGEADAAALAALLPLVDRLDPTRPRGRGAAEAAALSAGALAFYEGDGALATAAYQVARRLGGGSPLLDMAAGQACLTAGDDAGASAFFVRALDGASRPLMKFLAHKWAALADNKDGRGVDALRHLGAMLGLWDKALVPATKTQRRPVPVVSGGVELGVELPEGGLPRIRVDVTPLVVLVADFPHDRERIQRAARASEVR